MDRRTDRGLVVGVMGARGGVGASTLAAVLARRSPRPAALVDLARVGGGLDVLLGLEASAGLRWPDLQAARGSVAGGELTPLLPRWGGCTVLSADRSRPGPPPSEAVEGVLAALADEHAGVVLDLDRGDALDGGAALRSCAVVVLVVPQDLLGVAGALAVRAALVQAVGDVRLVVRGPAPGGLSVADVAQVLELPVVARVRAQRGLARSMERGGGPGARSGSTARAARAVLAALG